ncbi:MAG: hypothetical protein A2039_09840 [Candidatus Melainabacteria bacterium GWA2_34_9]|nr:MAG: hypothetical protein A2039_09840 [Candidatus Melainabacteria bacterium GWA2_34_9]
MDREDIKYEINNYIEVRKNLWTAIIVLSGGLTGLLLNIQNIKMNLAGIIFIVLLLAGSFLDYLFVKMLGEVNTDIQNCIVSLKKEINK